MMQRLCFQFHFPCDAGHNVERFADLGAFLRGQFVGEFIYPAITFFNPLLYKLLTFVGETQQFSAAVVGILDALDQSTLDEFIH